MIKVKRVPDAKGAVNLSTGRIANGITMKSLFVPADKDEGTVNISVAAMPSPDCQQNVIIMGVLKNGKETITRYLPAIPIKVIAKSTRAINSDSSPFKHHHTRMPCATHLSRHERRKLE